MPVIPKHADVDVVVDFGGVTHVVRTISNARIYGKPRGYGYQSTQYIRWNSSRFTVLFKKGRWIINLTDDEWAERRSRRGPS